MTFGRILFAAACLLSFPAFADGLIGQASVIDGDTLEIHGTRIRLWGIDAPESNQLCGGQDSLQYRCGAKAANDLDAFIARRPVGCIPISLDRYGRTVALCSTAGVDLGEWLVDRKSTRLNSSHTVISYAVFCLEKKKLNVETAPVSQSESQLRRMLSN